MERIAQALEPYHILFMEDVMPPVYPDEIKLLSQKTSIPIVGSELLMTRWQLREWMEKHVAQILMTDTVWNGGIGETRKIAAMAEAFGLPLVLHNIAGPICHAAVYAPGRAHSEPVLCGIGAGTLQDVFPDPERSQRRSVEIGHLTYPVGAGPGCHA